MIPHPPPEALAETHARAFAGGAARPWTAAEFAALLGRPGLQLTGTSRAFALVRVVADEAELLTLATDPAHQRLGLGRRVLDEAMARAAAGGALHLFLEVAEDNHRARALYGAAGFREAGRRRDYYRSPEGARVAALVMECPLRQP